MKIDTENTSKITCVVTGANGYVGSQIKQYLEKQGLNVIGWGHSPSENNIAFSLGQDVDPKMFKGVDVLIHCAYDFRAVNWKTIRSVNIDGSIKLFEAAYRAGVKRLIFISTISAFENCKSMYGQAKLEIEAVIARLGGVSVRPGLVYGERPGGMVGMLNKAVALLPVVPLVGSGNQILCVTNEEDLGRLIYTLAIKEGSPERQPIIAASEKLLKFKEILKILAERKRVRRLFIPIPVWPLLALLKLKEWIGLKKGFRSDSLVSLVNQNPNPDFQATRRAKVVFREFDTT